MRKTPLVLAAVAITLALALVGCSSSSKDKERVDSSSAPPVSLSGAVTDKGTKDASGDGATPTLELEVDDNYFEPTFTQFAPGAVVTVELKNEGSRDHTFTPGRNFTWRYACGSSVVISTSLTPWSSSTAATSGTESWPGGSCPPVIATTPL